MNDKFETLISLNFNGEIPDVRIEIEVNYTPGGRGDDDSPETEIVSVKLTDDVFDENGKMLLERGFILPPSMYDEECIIEDYAQYRIEMLESKMADKYDDERWTEIYQWNTTKWLPLKF